LRLLNELDLRTAEGEIANFETAIAAHGWAGLHPAPLEFFQMNLGKMCNMTCRHCHVDAGPDRWDQMMSNETVEACLRALDMTSAHTVDLTGGAPEMHPRFQYIIAEVHNRGKHVIDRCNLTILLVPKFRDLPEWLATHEVEIVCSLPHFRPRNTDAQRGDGTFEKSIQALQLLNSVGYGQGDPRRKLTLMANPAGAFLAGNQCAMEPEWKETLERQHGVTFDSLIALNNMPIARFLEWLQESNNLKPYLERLLFSLNPATIAGLMCRNTISISWRGLIYDCDFNQMLNIPSEDPKNNAPHIRDFDLGQFKIRRIRTARHCFGCTAGSGSSCGGALTE
jgi:radical SAM/Cys-rich protein